MTTTTTQLAAQSKRDKAISYVPFGEAKQLTLTIGMVRSFLTRPTRNGYEATDADCVKFMMLCQSRRLNPWSGDAFLVGYDTKDGPEFSLITSHQALLKRAEASREFDGIRSGVVVVSVDGVEMRRRGDMVRKGETLIGGWAELHRKDRSIPCESEVDLAVYSTGRSRWAKDPGGMIAKVARAAVLRLSYPTELSGLYIAEEADQFGGGVDDLSGGVSELVARLPSQPQQVQQAGKQAESSADIIASFRRELSACEQTTDCGKVRDAAYQVLKDAGIARDSDEWLAVEVETDERIRQITEERGK